MQRSSATFKSGSFTDGSRSSATSHSSTAPAAGTAVPEAADAAHGDLKVAHGISGNWNISIWDSEGNVGEWPNLSEHDGSIWISYHDAGERDLIFGRYTGTTLDAEVVDDGDFIGADSSHSWVGDTVVIMFHDGVNNDAKLAVQTTSGWDVSTHMNAGAVGFFNSVAVDGDGQINWANFNHSTTDIVFQRFDLPSDD